MNLAHYLALVHHADAELARALREVAGAHGDEPDIVEMCHLLAGWSDRHVEALNPFVAGYGEGGSSEPERLHSALFEETREGPLGMLRDLHDLYLMATECEIAWTVIGQAARGARDRRLVDLVVECEDETSRTLQWLRTRIKAAAPQTLVTA